MALFDDNQSIWSYKPAGHEQFQGLKRQSLAIGWVDENESVAVFRANSE